MKQVLIFSFLLLFSWAFTQISTQPKTLLQKDPFFQTSDEEQVSSVAQKVELVHADEFKIKQELYEGNPFFSGNVRFFHQGSFLSADEVILYKEQNFVKAKGNVVLQNADGSVITAEEMEYDGNMERGIARKNVLLSDPKQTIKTQTLYYDRKTNQAFFNTGGSISDGQNVMYTQVATYHVSSRIIDFTGNVKIDNPQYLVEGTNIKQHQNTNTAEFFGATKIINKSNPLNYVYTERGKYDMNSKQVWLEKNSRIYYQYKTLTGDRMFYNQVTGFGRAEGNVTLDDPRERRFIKGGYGEIYEKSDSAMITQKPYAVKILDQDSIYFSAEKILAFQKMDTFMQKKSYLRAFKKARMFKSNAQARADSISFDETDGVLHLNTKPILWSGEKQVTGDKIEVYFDVLNEKIDSLRVLGNAFAISKVDSLNTKDEFHQVKGRVMMLYYENNDIKKAQVLGNAQAITYADSQNETSKGVERIGVVISTCGTIEADMEQRKIQVVSCNIGAKTETYPMSQISKEQRFFSDFNWNTRDRLREWRDIFLDSPENTEMIYTSDNQLYELAQKKLEAEKAKQQAQTPKRKRK